MSKAKVIIVSLAVYLALGFVTFIFAYGYICDLGKANAIKGGITAIAEIKYLYADPQEGSKFTIYDLWYEYISEDGVKYSEIVSLGTTNREEAESHIGEKITIYIDGKGNSIPVDQELNTDYNLIISIVCGVLILAYTVGLIIVCVREHRWATGRKRYFAEKAAKENSENHEP